MEWWPVVRGGETMAVKIHKPTVYINRELKPEERQSRDIQFVEGELPIQTFTLPGRRFPELEKDENLPQTVSRQLASLKDREYDNIHCFVTDLGKAMGPKNTAKYKWEILKYTCAIPTFMITDQCLVRLEEEEGIPGNVLEKLAGMKNQRYTSEKKFLETVDQKIGKPNPEHKESILKQARLGPGMVDKKIEADEERMKLVPGEGNICIGIQPGDQLGELYINVQYEGPKGMTDLCMKGQNNLLVTASDWLKDIFSEFDGDWDVTVEGVPCPKTSLNLAINEATHVLDNSLDLESALNIVKDHHNKQVVQQRDEVIHSLRVQ
jgi:hypothetical protein